MTTQLIPGGWINRDGLLALKIEATVSRWHAEGKVRRSMPGTTVLYSTDDIIAQVAKCERKIKSNLPTPQGAKG